MNSPVPVRRATVSSTPVLTVGALVMCLSVIAATSCKKVESGESPSAANSTSATSPVTAATVPVATTGRATAATTGTSPATPTTVPALPAAKLDTLRGTVQRVGNDPLSVIVLSVSGNAGTKPFALHGPHRALLERATGLEIVVSGTLTNTNDMQAAPRGATIFEVRSFEVRAADGVAAIDGVVTRQGSAYSLVTQSGRRVDAPHLPAELRSQVGARVFLTGSMQQPPSAYGIIAAK